MATVENVEKKIRVDEGFNVCIKYLDGKDVRSDKQLPAQYPSYDRMENSSMTVSGWKDNRFYPTFPGFGVDVIDGGGEVVHGRTTLENVRASYRED